MKYRLALLVAVLTTGLTAVPPVAVGAPPAFAAPGDPAAPDDEGGTAALRAQLDAASKGFLEAKAALAISQKRQRKLAASLKRVEADLARRNAELGETVSVAYRRGRLGAISALLNADSPDNFLDRVAQLDTIAARQNQQLRDLLTVRSIVRRTQTAVAAEIRQQRRQVQIMAVRKQQAERALEIAFEQSRQPDPPADPPPNPPPNKPGGQNPPPPRGGPVASPAPRNPDGSFPPESCRLNDPTTDGCITARTLHALQQARVAGFTRFCSCHRDGGSGEHPKGRACDFAAQRNGFGGVATGGDRAYGDRLADYFIRNVDRLGVLYVIWFKRIWLPSSGWRAYGRGHGDPASDHTNHVHLSVV